MTLFVGYDIPETCCSCGIKTPLDDLHKAPNCEDFICSACGTYHQQPWALGYLCEKCYSERESASILKGTAHRN